MVWLYLAMSTTTNYAPLRGALILRLTLVSTQVSLYAVLHIVTHTGAIMVDNDEDYTALSNYARLDGTEIGEYVCELLCLNEWQEAHGMTSIFRSALTKELEYWLERFRKETCVSYKTIKTPDRIEQELIWVELTHEESE